jgi:hypothetical protein
MVVSEFTVRCPSDLLAGESLKTDTPQLLLLDTSRRMVVVLREVFGG